MYILDIHIYTKSTQFTMSYCHSDYFALLNWHLYYYSCITVTIDILPTTYIGAIYQSIGPNINTWSIYISLKITYIHHSHYYSESFVPLYLFVYSDFYSCIPRNQSTQIYHRYGTTTLTVYIRYICITKYSIQKTILGYMIIYF